MSSTGAFASRLLKWYAVNARRLPWRANRDPYRVWVSEVMLQQTRVETVIPYYRRWLKRFPSLKALAAAPLRDVLKHWEGLGYYARARNLHRAARKVAAEMGGQLPRDPAALQTLPGVGRYTAAAIASIAFDAPLAVLDGNVKRVLARAFNLTDDVNSAAGEKRLWALAGRLLPPRRAADYNQAIMDLGATVCRPKAPNCPACPLLGLCEAQLLGVQEARPAVKKKASLPHYHMAAGIIRKNGRVLIAQRPADNLLGGLWEFPGGRRRRGEALPDCLQRALREALGVEVAVGAHRLTLKHAFTHFKITVHVFEARWLSGRARPLQAAACRWARAKELGDYPMGKVDRAIADIV